MIGTSQLNPRGSRVVPIALGREGPSSHNGAVAEDLLTDVEQRRSAALQRLAAVAGDTAVCAVTKSGQAFPAAKFHEGAVAALGEVRRSLRLSGGEAGPVVGAVLEEWLDRESVAADRGADWRAYTAGGVEELRLLQADWT
jgi:hypothetical protein